MVEVGRFNLWKSSEDFPSKIDKVNVKTLLMMEIERSIKIKIKIKIDRWIDREGETKRDR